MQMTVSSRPSFFEHLFGQRGLTRGFGAALLSLLMVCLVFVSGCGSGGYAGGGIVSLSASSVTIDSGQQFSITSNLSTSLPVSWTLSSGQCTESSCGTLSAATGTTVTYTAPTVASQMKMTLTATVVGTKSQSTVAITVNPLPTLTGVLPPGTVGTAYSSTLTAAGGTGTLKLSISSGALPAGLSFNTSTGAITGTPTTAGTSNFTVQVVDASDVPYTLSVPKSIVVSTTIPTLTVVSGNPPAGTVGVAYSSTLLATGGTSPYTWSVLSGTLPGGLSLSASSGVISGTPTAAGTSTFTAQVTDASGAKASASFSITVTAAAPVLTLTVSSLPNGVVGTPYSATIGVSGGTAPYSCVFTAGTLPAGLSLSGCVVSGTPTVAGTANLTVKATDASNPQGTVSGPVSLTIAPTALSLTLTSLPNGMVGTPYSAVIGVSGGTSPYSCAITAGNLPTGLSLSGCTVSGTPTVAGTANMTVKATDSSNPAQTTTGPVSLTITPAALSISLSTLPSGTVGVAYSQVIAVAGGTSPYSCSVVSGTLPAGLSISGCTVSGTPTVAGTATLSIHASDSSAPVENTTGPVSLTINPAGSLTLTSPPPATVGTPYSGPITVTGGTGPYQCSLVSGTLPAGLSLTGCTITGTPTVAGSTTVTVKGTDSSSPATSTNGAVTITVNPSALSISLTSLPNGTVGTPYSQVIGVTGGTAPYSCQITAGVLQAGLTLTGCTVSGTPTAAGTANLTVKATDSSSPIETATGPVSLTISPATLVLTLSTLPNGMVGTPYSQVIGVSGGTAPYACTVTAGTLPAGLTLSGCTVSGIPTTAGTSNLTVKVTDTGTPVQTTSGPVSLTIKPATLTLTLSTLPNGMVGTPYSQVIGVAGGTAPYSCAVTSGTLPAGLTLAGCTVSGTPTVAGTANLTVKATDSGSPAQTVSGPVSLTIDPAAVTLTLTSPAPATMGVPYNGTIGVTGGTGPYTCAITTGTLPAGLAAANCAISGTPTATGTSNLTVKATDSSSPAATKTGPVTLTVNAAPVTLTITSPTTTATVGVPYTGVIGVTGGTAPYTCSITAGTLPAGLTATNCTISGTPTATGTANLTVQATDSSTPAASASGPVVVTVNPVPALTFTGSLPNAVVNVAYTQTLAATGGIGPYTYAITTGALPAGLTLSSAGVVSGTPTAVGASTFTVTATDSEATPKTAALPLVLLVTYAVTPNDPELSGPYAFLFQGYDDSLAGVLAYQTATVGSFTADGAGAIGAGELDSNHQTSTATGNTIASNSFIGTYQIGTNHTGFMTITTFNSNGTAATTSTYAITTKAPVAPATASAEASFIEYDNDQLRGTRGSGTMLAQQPTSFAAGLNGSYVFGLSGDTPCLPSCTIGIIAGPAASVGQFTTDGIGAISSGTGDTTIASTAYSNVTLSGTYGTADSNGRLQLSMATDTTPVGIYPTDYAVYVVSANQAFILSNDKHSNYVLLAGSAQLQTQATFSNASMTGPYVGYENSPTNPGVVGALLQNTLNLSTATIFRGTADAAGDCNISNVDVAGLTGLVNGLTGLGSGVPLLNAVLGTYQSVGNTSCPVAANGRGVLNYPLPNGLLSSTLLLLGLGTNPPPARVFYLAGPNRGYFLETGYAGLGTLEPQVGSPFTTSTLNGTYVYGSTPASSAATINGTGFFSADGAGHATATQNLNVGVGTINILQLGVGSTYNYTLTDAAAGRFRLGTNVIVYAINPGRFVLIDTDPLTTSPAVSLLY